jgi:hypothetical protein
VDDSELLALERLITLLHWSGDIPFGDNLEVQLAITTGKESISPSWKQNNQADQLPNLRSNHWVSR